MIEIYIVLRIGVYDQGVFGVYNDPLLALNGAKTAIKQEEDDYHRFEVLEYNINKLGYEQSSNVVYSLSRNDEKITIVPTKHLKEVT